MENKILELKNKFKNGSFELTQDENIRKILKEKKVPNEYEVYIIYGCKNNKKEIIYIGKAGTVNNDGSFKNQGLEIRKKIKK